MCIPGAGTGTLAAIKLGVSAASAVGGAASSYFRAQSQNERAAQNAQSAKDAYYLKAASLNRRIRQERVSAGQKKRDASLKAMRARATGKAAAAAGNVQGISVQRLLEDYSRSEARVRDRITQQTEANVSSLRQQQKGARAEARQRIEAVQPAGMENLFGSVVKAGAQGFNAYTDYSETINGED